VYDFFLFHLRYLLYYETMVREAMDNADIGISVGDKVVNTSDMQMKKQ